MGPRLDLHASTFDVDERAIGIGITVMVNSALLWHAPGELIARYASGLSSTSTTAVP